jgi:hypothetical protein
VRDRHAGTTQVVSRSAEGVAGNGLSFRSWISADGQYVAFDTNSTNLLPGGGDSKRRVYMSVVNSVNIASIVPDHLPIDTTTNVTITGSGFEAGFMFPYVAGANVSNLIVVNENTLTMDITVPVERDSGARTVLIGRLGDGPGIFTGSGFTCTGCVTFF